MSRQPPAGAVQAGPFMLHDEYEALLRQADPTQYRQIAHDTEGRVAKPGQLLNAEGRPYTPRGRGKRAREAKVRVERNAQEGNRLEVHVCSAMRPGIFRRQWFEPSGNDALDAKMAGTCGGAAAEHCCDEWGDDFDPSECARQAKELCSELLRREAEGGTRPVLQGVLVLR